MRLTDSTPSGRPASSTTGKWRYPPCSIRFTATRIGSFGPTVTGLAVITSAIGTDMGRPVASTFDSKSRSVKIPVNVPFRQTSR